MRIEAARVYQYTLPFRRPLLLKGERFQDRSGLLIELTADSGHTGWGEAAPLPGFSTETLAGAAQQLKDLAPAIVGRELAEVRRGPSGIPQFAGSDVASSVRFAMETALWDLDLVVTSPACATGIPVNALVMGDSEEILSSAQASVDAGFRTVKLKVGRGTVQDDVEIAHALAAALGPHVHVRMDANQAWSFKEAIAFTTGVSDLEYEYLEEPLTDPTGLRSLVEGTGARIALDESLHDVPADRLPEHEYVTAIVMKPTLIGGLNATAAYVAAAARCGMTPVLSAAYESGVGTQAMARLAVQLGLQHTAMGFDTYSRLAEDVLDPRLDMKGGILQVGAFAQEHTAIRRNMLEELGCNASKSRP